MPTLQQEIEFSDLLKRNYQTINSICLRFCGGNAFYFDELRQECALAIWTEFSHYGLDRFRGDSTEATWIYQISYHAIVDYLRNPNHQELPCGDVFSSRNSEQAHSSLDSPKTFLSVCDLYSLENLYGSELLSQARDGWSLIDELSEHLDYKERNLLNHYLSDDSYSTISRTEGITESNARKRMSRLLNKLRMLIHK